MLCETYVTKPFRVNASFLFYFTAGRKVQQGRKETIKHLVTQTAQGQKISLPIQCMSEKCKNTHWGSSLGHFSLIITEPADTLREQDVETRWVVPDGASHFSCPQCSLWLQLRIMYSFFSSVSFAWPC